MYDNVQQKTLLYCPKCGEPVEVLVEGYCSDCLNQMQEELWLQNAAYDAWQKLSDRERDTRIKDAVRHA